MASMTQKPKSSITSFTIVDRNGQPVKEEPVEIDGKIVPGYFKLEPAPTSPMLGGEGSYDNAAHVSKD